MDIHPIYSESTTLYSSPEDNIGEPMLTEVFEYTPLLTEKYSIVRGFCFTEKQKVCIFIDNNNHPGIPGGKVEKGETSDDALIREIYEEVNAEVLRFQPIGITRFTFPSSSQIDYMLIYRCEIKLFSGGINDPDKDIKSRKIVSLDELDSIFSTSKQMKTLISLLR